MLRLPQLCVFTSLLGAGAALFACSSDAGGPGGVAGGPTTGGSSVIPTGGTQAGVVTGGAGATSAGVGGATGGSPMAGAGGSFAVAGSGGAQAGAAGSGGGMSHLSPGCGKDNTEDPTKWTTHDINVTVEAAFTAKFGMRRYFTRPPQNYDKNTPIPLTIWGQGCGQSVAENTPMTIGPAAQGSVQLQLLADADNHQCYYAGPDGDDAKTPELPYFDQALSETLANYCIDTSKIYMGGYSSGAWLTALVSCNRTKVVRGVGWAAAGLQKNHADCDGPVAAIITRGENDSGTPLDQTLAARDSLIMRNGCTTATQPWDPGEQAFDTSSCLAYQGCKPGYPVIWCPTPGGHTNTVGDTKLSPQGFWKFWTSLPPAP